MLHTKIILTSNLSDLDKYNDRSNVRNSDNFDIDKCLANRGENDKFKANGDAKPFYGLACIGWIKDSTDLYYDLITKQNLIYYDLACHNYDNVFTFLDPWSFHMTFVDVDPSNKYNPQAEPFIKVTKPQFAQRLAQIKKSFKEIGRPGKIKVSLENIGLKNEIAVSVKISAEELKKVLGIEKIVQNTTGCKVRNFTGHITLAYLNNIPASEKQMIEVLSILKKFKDTSFGEYIFDEIDYTLFKDMNNFIPILTLNTETGAIQEHSENKAKIDKILK